MLFYQHSRLFIPLETNRTVTLTLTHPTAMAIALLQLQR